MTYAIYGAKSLALGMYKAIKYLYPEEECIGFVVNSRVSNPSTLDDLPVIELDELKNQISVSDRNDLHILICTPEDLHQEISNYLDENEFRNYTPMDSVKESKLMERYFVGIGKFKSLHELNVDGASDSDNNIKLQVYQAKFFKDRPLKNFYESPNWMIPIQVGAALTDVRVTDCLDNGGDNISVKNVNYCELTALYWMWKNKLSDDEMSNSDDKYYGLFHYRRVLDISDEDICRIRTNDVDAVVAFPTLHEPDIFEHHSRYIQEADWEAMLQALRELQPDYADKYDEIFAQEYMYNYNMIIAKKSVLRDYCQWLFPILERTEELSVPKGWERKDRYIGYLGENLMTLYFFYNKEKLNVVHSGRIMLT